MGMAAEVVKKETSGLAKMRESFPDNQISQLPKPTKSQSQCPPNEKRNCAVCGGWHHPKVVHLSYVGHAAITDRLLDCDPAWSWEPLAFDPMGLPLFDSSGGLWIKLTVCGVTRLGYGHAEQKDHMDAGAREKEVIGDALRNACMRFGAALELWHKGELHVEAAPVVEGEFVEPAQLPEPGKEVKASSPKANGASAAKPSASVSSSKTNGSAQPSASTTPKPEAKAEPKPEPKPEVKAEPKKSAGSPKEIVDGIAPEKLNSYLTSVMKQMSPPWKVIDIRNFYAQHFDAENEMPAPDAMDPELKRSLLTKIIEVNKVAPF